MKKSKNMPVVSKHPEDAIQQGIAESDSIHRQVRFAYWREFLVIALCIFAVYGQALRYEFVTYDDFELIAENGGFLSKMSNIVELFKTSAGFTHHSNSAYYRPIQLVTYIFDYQVWQLNPFGYHLTSILLHVATTFVVFLLMMRIVKEKSIALFASLLFALHPIQTESVAWVSGRIDLLLGLAITLMMYFYLCMRQQSEHSTRYRLLAMAAFALALFTKESAAFYLLLLPLYDICVENVSLKELFSRRSRKMVYSMGGILAMYLIVRLNVIGEFVGAERLYGTTPPSERIFNSPAILMEHVALLIAPLRQSIAHPVNELLWLRMPWNILAYIVPLLVVATLWLAWRRDRVLCFGLAWAILGLVPTLNILPIAVPIMEHRLYVPLIGFALVLARTCALLFDATQKKHRYAITIGIIVCVYAVLSFLRIPIWKNSETLWNDSIEKSPRYDRAYFNLAGYYFEQQQYDKTISMMQQYIQLRPDDFVGYARLRQTYFLAGHYSDAAFVCRQLIALSPNIPARYLELGELYEKLGAIDSAAQVYQQGILVNPGVCQLHDRLGSAFIQLGNVEDSRKEYLHAIELEKSYAPPYFGLAKLEAATRNYRQAITWVEEGLKRGNATNDILQLLSYLYEKTGEKEKARLLKQQYGF
jgi:Flp pilus assembly protein TadD